jgi:hypothetical protein
MVIGLLSRMTTARVGVSAPFKHLRDTPPALHVARVMLRGPTDSASSVAVFDGSILATAAVSVPEAMIKRSALRWTVLATSPIRIGIFCLKRFGCGWITMRR